MLRRPTDTIEIPTTDGAAVRGDLYLPGDRPPSGVVVLCHGFKGHKTWGFFPYLAGRLCETGVAAYTIDFSLNGTFPEPGMKVSLRPDLFRKNTLEREIDDLALTIRIAAGNGFGGRVDRDAPIGLFGHSRGGVSAMLNAPANERVRALCTWSTPDHPDRFSAAQKVRWREKGEYDFTDVTDRTRLSLSVGYLDDLEKNHDLYDLRRRAMDLRIPHLIVHGEMDLAVPVQCARVLHEAEQGLRDKRLLVLRTGHTFGVTDPPGMNTDNPPHALVEACDATVDWFDVYLSKGT